MKFFQIDDPREVIPIGCRLLQLFGLGSDDKLKLLYWVQCVFYFVFSLIPRVLMEIPDTVTLLRLVSELTFVSYLYCQILGLYFRRNQLYRLIGKLQTCCDKPYAEKIVTFIERSIAKINKLSVTCCKYFLFAFTLYCTLPLIASCAVYVRNLHNQTGAQEEYIISSEMKYGLGGLHNVFKLFLIALFLISSLYYLDIRYDLLYYAFYTVIIFLLTVTSALSLCVKDVVDVSLINTTSVMLEVTAMQIRQLRGRITEPELTIVIDSHQETLQCANNLQDALNLSLLIQLTFCSAIWCLMLFYILLMVCMLCELKMYKLN
uniref:Uncharacterized protein n=1 Tax=Anopheles farauti TaxID=69004 RepID=A0A182QW75_9DIPT